MLKEIYSDCLIGIEIEFQGPVLIRSGQPALEDPDMRFVRTFRNGRFEIYIPGSSFKGMLRAHAERITRTLAENYGIPVVKSACDPFSEDKSCSKKLEKFAKERNLKKIDGVTAYKESCLICKLFGSTSMAGRLKVEDCYLNPSLQDIRPEIKDGVGIDRFTGGVASGPFQLEVVPSAKLKSVLHIRNFELWQFGCLAYVFKDLEEGLIRIGAGKSRGLGKISGTVQSVTLSYVGTQYPTPPSIWGIRKFFQDNSYGFFDQENSDINVSCSFQAEDQNYGLRKAFYFKDKEQIEALWQAVAPLFNSKVKELSHEEG
ncbi:MAG TPA: RAMP superfamily CRISPR-associated protein [Thermodesulfobacteriota bacterium]|nr:RAMP superfamily CRISPR-associated protein [Thermodesulfobacteriota bacterium]